MKITEYPSVSELNNSDEIILSTGDGTKKASLNNLSSYIQNSDVEGEMSDDQILVRHRNTFRGKNLGTSFTDEQLENIQNGSFKDLYVGDYWGSQGNKWRIADIDYYMNTGYPTTLTDHHLVVIPDNYLYTSKFFENAITYVNGYLNSYIRVTGLTQAKSLFNTVFNNHIIKYMDVFASALSDTEGAKTWVWNEASVELINPNQLGNIIDIPLAQSKIPQSVSYKPFALFLLNYKFIMSNGNYWLNNINTKGGIGIGYIQSTGDYKTNANSTLAGGVRPYALIG